MTDFVITEHDIELLNDPVMDKKKIWVRVRSRPLSDELKKERERVLDELLEWNEHDRSITEIMITRSHEWWHRRFKETIESLRGEP